jgi:N-acyl homoserine lactone hydrolase
MQHKEDVMNVDGYDIDILIQGYPGKTVCHGGLGWSTVVLIRGRGHVAMVDTGGFGVRGLVMKGLKDRGLKPADVTDLLITHAHHDHCINFPLLSRARIVIGAQELAWAVKEPWGETPVPELYVRELQTWPKVHKAADGEEVLPGIKAHVAPGHTPGHLMYVLAGQSPRRDLHRRRRQEPRRDDLPAGRRELRRRRQHQVDRGHLDDLAQAAGQYPGPRP